MKLAKKLKSISKAVRPLLDRVLVKKLEYEHPTLAVVGVKLQKGVVIAVGPGRRMRRKVRFDKAPGALTGALYFEDGPETGAVRPMRVKVGDVVEFSPRGEIEWDFGGETLFWIKEQACYGTSNDSRSSAFLWQKSGGHDRHGNFMPGTQLL